MKVVELGPFPPPQGGVETNLVAIRDYLRKTGHECEVINITRYRKEETDGVYYPGNALELIQNLFRKRYDIVHLHIGGRIPTRVVALALACASVPWAKSVMTFHSGGYPSSEEGKATKAASFTGFVMRRLNGIIAVNEEIVNFFARLGVKRERIRCILPHAVSHSRVADQLTEPLKGFFAQHNPVFTAVCGLEPEYDLPLQINAMERVLDRHPKAGLAILGSGSIETEIRSLIVSKPYSTNLLLCGDVPHDVTLRAVADSHALLRTTLYDGDAISIREAQYLGTPVIATDNGMRPEGLELIPIGDGEALVKAIERVLAAGAGASHRGRNDEENLQAVIEFYEDLLNRRVP